MAKDYFSQQTRKHLSKESKTVPSSGSGSGSGVSSQADQISLALDKYREIKPKRVVRKYAVNRR